MYMIKERSESTSYNKSSNQKISVLLPDDSKTFISSYKRKEKDRMRITQPENTDLEHVISSDNKDQWKNSTVTKSIVTQLSRSSIQAQAKASKESEGMPISTREFRKRNNLSSDIIQLKHKKAPAE